MVFLAREDEEVLGPTMTLIKEDGAEEWMEREVGVEEVGISKVISSGGEVTSKEGEEISTGVVVESSKGHHPEISMRIMKVLTRMTLRDLSILGEASKADEEEDLQGWHGGGEQEGQSHFFLLSLTPK